MTGVYFVSAGLAAAFLAYFLVSQIRRLAETRQILDYPNARSSHSRPTPRGGGLALVVVTLAGLGLYAGLMEPEYRAGVGAYALGAVIVAGVSALDDVRSLSAKARLAAHLAAATWVVVSIGAWPLPGLPSGALTIWAGISITVVWIVGLTNVYNFMDGIDGLAAGQAVLGGAGWGLLGALTGQPLVAGLGVLLAGSSLGFLGHNWPPARIFMGDVGSAFLGYSFAVLPLLWPAAPWLSGSVGLLLVWPFIFDATFTLARRLRRREDIFEAHRTHLYQRLVIAAWPHVWTTVLYLGLAGVGAGLAVVLVWTAEPVLAALALTGVMALAAGLWVLVQWQERQPRQPGQ